MLTIPEMVAGVASLFLLYASYADLKTGEIPEKITRGLIVAIIVMASVSSFYTLKPSFILESVVSGVGFFALGYVMFRLGEWGGGDVKLLAGIGCSLGLLGAMDYFVHFKGVFPYYVGYFINFALASTPYVITYSVILGLMKPSVFTGFTSIITKKKSIALLVVSFLPSTVCITLDLYKLTLVYLLIPFLVLISLYLKAVEDVALKKTIHVRELKEEDILSDDLVVGGRRIVSKRDMEGLSKEQVSEIQSLADQGKIPADITVRWGIRFAPVFFLAFLLTFFLGDLLEIIVLSIVA